MKKLLLVLAFMLSLVTFAQDSPTPPPTTSNECYYVTYRHTVLHRDCPPQSVGAYILKLCYPFFNGSIDPNWKLRIDEYWCENGKFPPGVEVTSYLGFF